VALVLLFLWYIGVFGGNVRTVQPGQVYRSAQLTGRNLDDVLKEDHIQTVINLRGGSVSDAWYRSEVASCKQFGAQHVDIDMSARLLPAPSRLDALLQTFDHARYPILYHCQSGADRSGLVGTLYLDVYQHVPLQEAEKEQLTWRYGHFSFGQTHAMNDFYTLYDQTNSGLDLRDWILKRYPAIYAKLPTAEKQQDTPLRSPSHVADLAGAAPTDHS
jgi:protein tyrosine/serine phosphatase